MLIFQLITILTLSVNVYCLKSFHGRLSFKMLSKESVPVVIIGGGISGFSCAKTIGTKKKTVILEKSNTIGKYNSLADVYFIPYICKLIIIGGRIQTDTYKGFLLDRGFQIYIDSYPQLQNDNIIDSQQLDLVSFNPGAYIYYNNAFHIVSDPIRRPADLLPTLLSPIGSFTDKIKVYMLLIDLLYKRVCYNMCMYITVCICSGHSILVIYL